MDNKKIILVIAFIIFCILFIFLINKYIDYVVEKRLIKETKKIKQQYDIKFNEMFKI